MRILVVEDHLDLAATLGDYLEAHGHAVDFAYDGRSGYTYGGGTMTTPDGTAGQPAPPKH